MKILATNGTFKVLKNAGVTKIEKTSLDGMFRTTYLNRCKKWGISDCEHYPQEETHS
ncbi:MAG: hypothetical protein Ct9H300mP28_14670 [Pseudomonadota bacterium]|nr:MAG: hypothetical protein Ct9H300mP28_14670 [Pseudomonadota bacterium]